MKKTLIFILGLFLILSLTSCGNNSQESNTKIQSEDVSLKEENEKLKQELESYKKETTSTGNETQKNEVQKVEENLLPPKQEVTQEDIKLAGCDETKKVGNVEWCMKNSQLIKEVEGFETRFSKSIQNDSGYKGIYETDNEDKLYTYNYLEKACGVIDGEGIITDGFVNMSCPCPRGFHIPTTKEWSDTYDFYKQNVNLFKNELGFTKISWVRTHNGSISKYVDSKYSVNANLYQTNTISNVDNYSQNVWIGDKEIFISISGDNKGTALSLRCIKNN